MRAAWLGLAAALVGCAPEKPMPARPNDTDTDTAPVCVTDTPTDSDLPPDSTGSTGDVTVPCQTLEWVVHLSSFSVDGVAGVELAPDGTVVLAGWYARDLTFHDGSAEPYVLPEYCGGTSDEMFLSKHALDGTLVWATRVGGCDHVRAKTFAVRPDGDIIVAGTLSGTVTFGIGEPNETVLATEGWTDNWIFVARYGPDGTFRWVSTIDPAGVGEDVNDVAVGEDGGIYVAGGFEEEIVFARGTPLELSLTGSPLGEDKIQRTDLFVAAYAEDGSFRWAQVAGTTLATDVGYGVVVLGDQVLVGARLGNPTTLGAGTAQEVTLTPSGSVAAPLLAYGAADGTFLSAEVMPGLNSKDLAAAGPDSLLMSGAKDDEPTLFGPGEENEVLLDGTNAWYLAEYGVDATLAWAAGGASGPIGSGSSLVAMTVQGERVVAAGYFIEGLTLPDGTAWLAKGAHDAFVVSYDDQHALECAWVLGGIDSDDATGAVADPDGGVIATGTFEQTLVIEDGKPERTEIVSDKGSTDIFLVRYK